MSNSTSNNSTPDTDRCPINHNDTNSNTTYDQGDGQGPTIHSENVDKSHTAQRLSMGGCPVMHQAHTTTSSVVTDW